MDDKGEGVAKDLKKAAEWTTKAAACAALAMDPSRVTIDNPGSLSQPFPRVPWQDPRSVRLRLALLRQFNRRLIGVIDLIDVNSHQRSSARATPAIERARTAESMLRA